jgi:rubrerythrin
MCDKIEYSSFREAQEVINDARKHRYNKNGERLNRLMGRKDKKLQRSYQCDVCGFWHITSQHK